MKGWWLESACRFWHASPIQSISFSSSSYRMFFSTSLLYDSSRSSLETVSIVPKKPFHKAYLAWLIRRSRKSLKIKRLSYVTPCIYIPRRPTNLTIFLRQCNHRPSSTIKHVHCNLQENTLWIAPYCISPPRNTQTVSSISWATITTISTSDHRIVYVQENGKK